MTVLSFIRLSIFECREDEENQIHCKQDPKHNQLIIEYNKMVHFCVSRVLQVEWENPGTFQHNKVGQKKVNFWRTLDVRLRRRNLIPWAGGSPGVCDEINTALEEGVSDNSSKQE